MCQNLNKLKVNLLKNCWNTGYCLKSTCLKWTYGHSGIDYRVAALSKSYLTTTGIKNHHVKFESDRTILTCQN